jgi:hypothetical protein
MEHYSQQITMLTGRPASALARRAMWLFAIVPVTGALPILISLAKDDRLKPLFFASLGLFALAVGAMFVGLVVTARRINSEAAAGYTTMNSTQTFLERRDPVTGEVLRPSSLPPLRQRAATLASQPAHPGRLPGSRQGIGSTAEGPARSRSIPAFLLIAGATITAAGSIAKLASGTTTGALEMTLWTLLIIAAVVGVSTGALFAARGARRQAMCRAGGAQYVGDVWVPAGALVSPVNGLGRARADRWVTMAIYDDRWELRGGDVPPYAQIGGEFGVPDLRVSMTDINQGGKVRRGLLIEGIAGVQFICLPASPRWGAPFPASAVEVSSIAEVISAASHSK